MSAEWLPIEMSTAAANTSNPIRKVVDQMLIKPETDKQPIPLSIGDPCTDGNLLPPENVKKALIEAIENNTANGYPPSAGYDAARAAIAKKFPGHTDHPINDKDVFVASGASHALQMAFDVLMEPGDNVLLPNPGFSLYKTICDSKGYVTNFYDLVAEKNWEANLEDLKAKIDGKTKAILVNNPSNPCGSNYSEQHLKDILAIAEAHKIPIIADEIYDGLVFEGETFTSIVKLTDTVPVLVCGGIAKMYVVPGWRVGWVAVHDRNGLFAKVRQGMMALTTLILGPNSLVQACIPEILLNTPQSYYDGIIKTLGDHAKMTYEYFQKIEGLKPVRPQGAMYVMVGIDMARFPDFKNDIDFSRQLLLEQAVMVLPGSCFLLEGFFRVVFTKPADKLNEAYSRIAEFCAKYRK